MNLKLVGGCRMTDVGCWMTDDRFKNLKCENYEFKIGCGMWDVGCWMLDGRWVKAT